VRARVWVRIKAGDKQFQGEGCYWNLIYYWRKVVLKVCPLKIWLVESENEPMKTLHFFEWENLIGCPQRGHGHPTGEPLFRPVSVTTVISSSEYTTTNHVTDYWHWRWRQQWCWYWWRDYRCYWHRSKQWFASRVPVPALRTTNQIFSLKKMKRFHWLIFRLDQSNF
jgi:hypothetical protein